MCRLFCVVVVCLALVSSARAATFTVINTNDSGAGSLRAAIESAEANGATADEITFNIPGPGPHTIVLLTGLPGLVFPYTNVRGDTQPGYVAGTPLIHLRPTPGNAAQTSTIFACSSGGCGIKGLNISGFTNVSAIFFAGVANTASANVIVHNGQGVYLGAGTNHVVGGFTIADRNVISSNTDIGVRLSPSPGSRNSQIVGNFIGTDPSGTVAWPNRLSGIHLDNSPGNTIRGTPTAPQIISGNGSAGISIFGTNTKGNLIVGNFIGTEGSGTQALPNDISGLTLDRAVGVTIGGSNPGDRNVIAGNQEYGVLLYNGATSNAIVGNLIGLASNGMVAVSNRFQGIRLWNAPSNFIGQGSGRGNFIAGNRSDGIWVDSTGSVGNLIYGNVIGMGPSSNVLPNAGAGIYILNSKDNRIGGTGAGEGNIIVGHPASGVRLDGVQTVGNQLLGNRIGLDAADVERGNSTGIRITVAPSNRVGNGTAAGRNVVSGNALDGVEVENAHATRIQGNYIGLNGNGTQGVSNHEFGVYIGNANDVVIGGTGEARNVIASSRLTGLVVEGDSSNTLIVGNYVGTSADGMSAIRNGSGGIGVRSDYTTVGGTNAQEGNLICGHQGSFGVEIGTGSHVRVMGNVIGVAVDGITALPNGYGIWLRYGARGVVVGGAGAGAGNVIARNDYDEVFVDSPAGGNSIVGNYIGVQKFGVAFGSLNVGHGVHVNQSASNLISGNVIGECYEGVVLRGTGAVRNVVQGNFIGEHDLEPMGNLRWGVMIIDGSDNQVGGLTVAERNLIASNDGGILVTNGTGNLLAANLVYSNAPRLSIDLGGDGSTTNDALDADVGANLLQNHPVVTNGFIAGNLVYAQGFLHSAPSQTFAVDIYRADGTNAGGRNYLGRVPVTTDGAGNGDFTAGFLINLAAGTRLAATATDADNNTSEFTVSPAGLVNLSGDADGDLIPDFWENLYGLSPAVSNAANSDLDTDGFTDYEEYMADTAANDGTLYPVIEGITHDVAAHVTVPSSGARVYRLDYVDDLVTSFWSQVGGSVTGLYGSTTLTDAGAATGRSYRVNVRLP